MLFLALIAVFYPRGQNPKAHPVTLMQFNANLRKVSKVLAKSDIKLLFSAFCVIPGLLQHSVMRQPEKNIKLVPKNIHPKAVVIQQLFPHP